MIGWFIGLGEFPGRYTSTDWLLGARYFSVCATIIIDYHNLGFGKHKLERPHA